MLLRDHYIRIQILDHFWLTLDALVELGMLPLTAILFTSNNGGDKCDCLRCLSVCLSVSKITQKCVHGFG